MKPYKNYMDNLSVDETLHEKIMYGLTQSSTNQDTERKSLRKYISMAICITLILLLIMAIYPNTSISNTSPNKSNSTIPNVAENPNPHEDEISPIQQACAVYHDIDVSKLIRQSLPSKVPYGYFFNEMLIKIYQMNSGPMNSRVSWEERKYAKNDIEPDLQTYLREPDLPKGDYTIEEYVLVDEITDIDMAYQTIYYYFEKSSLEFQNKFSIFYFVEQDFKSDLLEEIKNTSMAKGEISISDFSEPIDVHVKMPYVRRLIYVENGTSIVIESEVDPVLDGKVVDKEKSLRKYRGTDKQLINMMKSIIVDSEG